MIVRQEGARLLVTFTGREKRVHCDFASPEAGVLAGDTVLLIDRKPESGDFVMLHREGVRNPDYRAREIKRWEDGDAVITGRNTAGMVPVLLGVCAALYRTFSIEEGAHGPS